MKSFEMIDSLVMDGMLEGIGAGEASRVVGGSLIIVVCIVPKDQLPAESAKVNMQDFHFVM